MSDFGCGGGPSIDIDVEQEFGCDQDIGGCEGSCSTTGSFSVPVGRLLGVFFLVLGAVSQKTMIQKFFHHRASSSVLVP